jgi:hypothetical protein
MDFRTAIKRQHHSALWMFKQAIERCPEDIWVGGTHPRNYWRIAYHALGYAHLYLYEDLASWKKWDKHRVEATYLEGEVEVIGHYTRAELLAFTEMIDGEVDARIDALDLDSDSCGFTWYPNVTRCELLILSLRHLHGHLGQLSEILIANGEDVEWMGEFKPEKA